VANGGILHVGIPNGTGTLTVNNGNVTLSGSTLMKLNPATKTSDAITTTNSIALGGTLTVSLLSGSPATGDTYKLFNAPVISGSFSSYNLPPLGPSQLWVNRLSTDGTLVVSELVLTANMIPGGFLQFTWPTQLNGLVKLQAQTNSLSTGLSSNWADYPGGTFNGTVIVPDPSLPTVFFRLISIP
jgi:hypothetical protein